MLEMRDLNEGEIKKQNILLSTHDEKSKEKKFQRCPYERY